MPDCICPLCNSNNTTTAKKALIQPTNSVCRKCQHCEHVWNEIKNPIIDVKNPK
jgi:hypothetical protein